MTWHVKLGTSADRDYFEILKRSRRLYGEEASNRYSNLIDAALEKIGLDPFAGKPLQNTQAQGAMVLHLRMVKGKLPPSGRVNDPRHLVIYFMVSGQTVFVSRILHDAMDAARHKLPKT